MQPTSSRKRAKTNTQPTSSHKGETTNTQPTLQTLPDDIIDCIATLLDYASLCVWLNAGKTIARALKESETMKRIAKLLGEYEFLKQIPQPYLIERIVPLFCSTGVLLTSNWLLLIGGSFQDKGILPYKLDDKHKLIGLVDHIGSVMAWTQTGEVLIAGENVRGMLGKKVDGMVQWEKLDTSFLLPNEKVMSVHSTRDGFALHTNRNNNYEIPPGKNRWVTPKSTIFKKATLFWRNDDDEERAIRNLKQVIREIDREYALFNDGEIQVRGTNLCGKHEGYFVSLLPFVDVGDCVIGLHCSGYGRSVFALTEEGQVFAWGDNRERQLAIPDRDKIQTPTRVPLGFLDDDEVIEKIHTGFNFTVFESTKGRFFVSGSNARGQQGVPTNERLQSETPQLFNPKLESGESVEIDRLTVGDNTIYVKLTSGAWFACGANGLREFSLDPTIKDTRNGRLRPVELLDVNPKADEVNRIVDIVLKTATP